VIYNNTAGSRLHLVVIPEHMGPSQLMVREGNNSSCPFRVNYLTIEEMRDLRYLLDRAIAATEEYERSLK